MGFEMRNGQMKNRLPWISEGPTATGIFGLLIICGFACVYAEGRVT